MLNALVRRKEKTSHEVVPSISATDAEALRSSGGERGLRSLRDASALGVREADPHVGHQPAVDGLVIAAVGEPSATLASRRNPVTGNCMHERRGTL